MEKYTDEEIREICGFIVGNYVQITEEPSEAQIQFGGCDNPKAYGVEMNIPYKVERIDIRSMHTKVKLEGIDAIFNSVIFDKDKVC